MPVLNGFRPNRLSAAFMPHLAKLIFGSSLAF